MQQSLEPMVSPMRWTRAMVVLITVAASSVLASAEARAACVARDAAARPEARRPQLAMSPVFESATESHTSIVGLWNSTFLVGNGPDVFDVGFQQWHADNTEMMVDNAVSPSFGNVCVGVWKQIGPRTYTLKHMTFNWNADGTLAGTFVLRMTVTLERRGNAFSGRFTADSFDLAGNVLPDLHVEGAARGARITVR